MCRQQTVRSRCAEPGQSVRARHRNRGRQADPQHRPESVAGVRAAAVRGRAGASVARSPDRNRGQSAEAPEHGQGRNRIRYEARLDDVFVCVVCAMRMLTTCFAGTAPGNFNIVIPNRVLTEAYAELRDYVVQQLEAQREQGINVSLRRAV